MVEVCTASVAAPELGLNVADRLAEMAAAMPDAIAVACARRSSRGYSSHQRGESGAVYATTTFSELNADVDRIVRGMADWGVPRGTRLALLVKPGIEFVTLVFALLRAGMVIVLVDSGLGRRGLIRCLSEAEPEGFVAIGVAQTARLWWRHEFPRARWNVTVGRRWFWGGPTLDELRARGDGNRNLPATSADDAAAIIFTSGSTGPPKGALYTHRMFDTQVAEFQSMYRIAQGGIDLSCFPLFGLFNSAMGVTTVFPNMDFSRPASADPRKLLAAANDWHVTQAFASPAVWRIVSEHCAKSGERIPSLRQVFSCGAPVPASVIRKTLACTAADAKMHTPYGATECLPIATIEAAEVLGKTAARTDEGAGVCVGRKFESIDWRVIRITDDPIARIDDAGELQPGEIGELIVRGPQASPRYVTRTECNTISKINDKRAGASSPPSGDVTHGGGDAPAHGQNPPWHRTGDVGYLDDEGRFWYCGRKSHRVETADGELYTESVEGIFNRHPVVKRTALVGIGRRGRQTPITVAEIRPGSNREVVRTELMEMARAHKCTSTIQHVLIHPRLPVDVRHNAKIHREALAAWAAMRLPELA